MKTRYKILIGVAIATLVAMIGFYIYFTGLLLPVEPLHFSLGNGDDVNNHNITVEIFNSKNESIFKETYELGPKEKIGSPMITKRRGKYMFKVTLDDEITRTYKADVGQMIGGQDVVMISVYTKDPISGEMKIWIGQKVV